MNPWSLASTPASLKQKLNTKKKNISFWCYAAYYSLIAKHSSCDFLVQQTAVFSNYFHVRTERWQTTKVKIISYKVLKFMQVKHLALSFSVDIISK